MAEFLFLVLSNPRAGREAEYNDWYENQHLPDVLKVPGFVGARRFRLVGELGHWRYLALYRLETDDPQSVMRELRSRAGGPLMALSEALDRSNVFAGLFEPIGQH